ncbi:MAG TPA: hypothetical protein VD996_09215 [Chitinophagaceae bacterium]|nr:hypothetical protein [Chitinophagaceae bacterium]
MKIRYYISARENILYKGEFLSDGRYKSFGQHSFIYDFLISAARNGLYVDLIVDGMKNFPILKIVQPYCNIYSLAKAAYLPEPDIVVADVVDEETISLIPETCPLVCIVHDAGYVYDQCLIERASSFICMTETAFAFQSRRIDPSKLCLIHQGVDLSRFRPVKDQPERANPSVLYYSRMNIEKRTTIFSVLDNLRNGGYNFTVLGDGKLFWEVSDMFGDDGVVLNHVPCHSIPQFITRFDVIISSGRGVMEACAAGKPAICAGLGYAGMVTEQNVCDLLRRNLTGFGFDKEATTLDRDIDLAMTVDSTAWRRLAELHFDMDSFVHSFTREAARLLELNNSYSYTVKL